MAFVETARRFLRLRLRRRLLRPLRSFLAARTPFFWVGLAAMAVAAALFFYLSVFLVDLVWEPEIGGGLTRPFLVGLAFLPLCLLLILGAAIGKVLLDFLRRREGTRLRSRLILTFLAVTLIPSFVLIAVFNGILQSSVDVFFRKDLVASMDGALGVLRENVRRARVEASSVTYRVAESDAITRGPEGELALRTESLADVMNQSGIDAFFVYGDGKRLFSAARRGEPSYRLLSVIDRLDLGRLDYGAGAVWSTLRGEDDLLVHVRRFRKSERNAEAFLVACVQLSPDLSPRIAGTVDAIRRFKQFQILQGPLKAFLFFLYLYFYVPVLILGMLYFFYASNRIARPLGRLEIAARSIAKGDYGPIIHERGDDEVRSLVASFNRMRQELQYNRIHIRRLGQAEAWREVAVRLAHEIKNPLTPILLAADRMEDLARRGGIELQGDFLEPLEVLRSEVRALKDLSQRFARRADAPPADFRIEPRRIGDFLRGFKDRLQLSRGVEGGLELHHEEGLEVPFDEGRIRQVLSNLIQNAMESLALSGSPGARVRVASRIEVRDDGSFWAVSVLDNGPGVPPGLRERIFQPYVSGKSRGSGLGLAICEEIVSGHGGKIFFESQNGRTVFTFLLPLGPREVSS